MQRNQHQPTPREDFLVELRKNRSFDMIVVGGGATGLGVAVDAASRGLNVVLIESHDFAKGTSSRSTKLLHGGVRYLAQGNLKLVREALHERTTILRIAPLIANPLAFVIPVARWWEKLFYGIGLTTYDWLAGLAGLGTTQLLNAPRTAEKLPGIKKKGLRGGVLYWDAQFNDAALAIALARTAASCGALVVNYCRADELIFANGKITGVVCSDAFTGESFALKSHCVINATGVWVDGLRNQDQHDKTPLSPLVSPSQGVHLVVDAHFLGGETALMVPKTSDGRVLFAVPWLGKVILGTTDTPRSQLEREPKALPEEVDFILRESAHYLAQAPQRSDIKSIWVGLRPLVKPDKTLVAGESTKRMSREHTIRVSQTGLLTVTGGKWTTYRAMAEEVIACAVEHGLLMPQPECQTRQLLLVGAHTAADYSTMPGANDRLGPQSPAGQNYPWLKELTQARVRFAVRYEFARTVEDVLARRLRVLFLDAKWAVELASSVAEVMRSEGIEDPQELEFSALASQYLHIP